MACRFEARLPNDETIKAINELKDPNKRAKLRDLLILKGKYKTDKSFIWEVVFFVPTQQKKKTYIYITI
ncbi:MAG: hypothetical protein DRQ51_02920 [Gammaproteobacteria bacterium]|nr:MAG: hypothetical protein DRQ51_02920 [Gammaproteobacteria bacterium]